ncbi:HD domain-containing phosphohydrolase [Stutzerimonas frequens]|uniref:HD domain-containing phosphohydrolase n=1 Tax=Stutzerimonas frequens TaxID=2968969 RepID=UPI001AAF1C0D|nr:HD domain-containing phosphohydrolase [Stutzerimonas frequens]QTF58249.1 response regulator [Stutzerimonas frequens]
MLSDQLCQSTVVVIDDVSASLRLLESSVRAIGVRKVVAFNDSAAGLAWLQRNDWNLLLLDVDMPAPNGFDILRELSGRDHNQMVIMVSALSDRDSRCSGLTLGANDFISKPLDLPELLLRVRNQLQLSWAGKQLKIERETLEHKVAERTEQLSTSYQSVIRSLSRAAQYRDDETGQHIIRIGESAAMIATALGQAPEWVERIRLAAPMHDVGKIGIPDQILLKPGRLTDPEREIMQRHTRIGHAILRDGEESPLLEMAAEIAMYHHERWDGTGYPKGLKGEEIPLAARIVALCDVYDALRSPRPYKQAWPLEKAQAYVVEQAGLHFDPCLVEVAKGIFQQIEEMQHRLSDPLVQLAEVEVGRAAAAATATLLRSVAPLPA